MAVSIRQNVNNTIILEQGLEPVILPQGLGLQKKIEENELRFLRSDVSRTFVINVSELDTIEDKEGAVLTVNNDIDAAFQFIEDNFFFNQSGQDGGGSGGAVNSVNALSGDVTIDLENVRNQGNALGGNVNFDGNGIINLAVPQNSGDASNKQYVDSQNLTVISAVDGFDLSSIAFDGDKIISWTSTTVTFSFYDAVVSNDSNIPVGKVFFIDNDDSSETLLLFSGSTPQIIKDNLLGNPSLPAGYSARIKKISANNYSIVSNVPQKRIETGADISLRSDDSDGLLVVQSDPSVSGQGNLTIDQLLPEGTKIYFTNDIGQRTNFLEGGGVSIIGADRVNSGETALLLWVNRDAVLAVVLG